ncbi:MAG: hypothetical protein HY825_01500 [Acidobacteria bacterium]|nr:hypothetical protein [Acidobacteriota bacterium]
MSTNERSIVVFVTDQFDTAPPPDDELGLAPPSGRDCADFLIAGLRERGAIVEGPNADVSLNLWAFVLTLGSAGYRVHVQWIPGAESKLGRGRPPVGHAGWCVSVSRKGWGALVKELFMGSRPGVADACAALSSVLAREPRIRQATWLSEGELRSWL